MIAVPIAAVQETDDSRYVICVKEDGTTEHIEVETGVSDDNYVGSVSFGAAEAQKIYEAFYQDCKEGTAQPYNSYTYNYEMPSNCYKETVFISYYFKTNRPEEFQLYFSSGQNYFSYEERKNLDGSSRFYVERYISFGTECKNLIQTLIDLEIIKSEEDLHTYQGEY